MTDRVGEEGQAGPSADKLRELRDVRNVLGIDETESPASAVLRERRASEAALAEARRERNEMVDTHDSAVQETLKLRDDLKAARAEATKAEDALRKIRDLHTRAAGYTSPVCISCDGGEKWPCETDRVASEALAAIRAPQPPEPVKVDFLWQPIETAPEATPVLVWLPSYGMIVALRTGSNWFSRADDAGRIVYPEKWLPIEAPSSPPPPSEEPRPSLCSVCGHYMGEFNQHVGAVRCTPCNVCNPPLPSPEPTREEPR